MTGMKLTSVLPWFGGKRTLAPTIVRELGEHAYYFEVCAGSMAVLFAKEPSSHETAIDLHGGLTNLAWILQKEDTASALYDDLRRVLYSDEIYQESKHWVANFEGSEFGSQEFKKPLLSWAYHYFIASWMGRNGVSGTARVNYQIATRWTQGGGSGPLRFRSAVSSIPAFHERLRNVHILRRDIFDVLPKIEDAEGVAIYADPPYLENTRSGSTGSGKGYVHDFTPAQHQQLAKELRRFRKARVVVSYYADPQLHDLYPGWTFVDCSRQKHLAVQNKRGTNRQDAPEVLLLNGPALSEDLQSDSEGESLSLFA